MAAKSRTMAQQKTKEAYCFIVPAFIYMILVLGYPIVYNIILSLKDVNVKNLKSGTSVFVGLQNYIDLFHDPTFLLVLRNTFIFTIACLIFQFTIGFAFAMFFNQKFKLAGPIRGLILVSYMMPMAVTGLLGKNIFSNAGLINDLLGKIGISGPEWLVNTSTALIAIIETAGYSVLALSPLSARYRAGACDWDVYPAKDRCIGNTEPGTHAGAGGACRIF